MTTKTNQYLMWSFLCATLFPALAGTAWALWPPILAAPTSVLLSWFCVLSIWRLAILCSNPHSGESSPDGARGSSLVQLRVFLNEGGYLDVPTYTRVGGRFLEGAEEKGESGE